MSTQLEISGGNGSESSLDQGPTSSNLAAAESIPGVAPYCCVPVWGKESGTRFGKKKTVVAYAKVDPADYEWAMQYRWLLNGSRPKHRYVVRGESVVRESGKRGTKLIYMHRELMRDELATFESRAHTDHINGDTLDNRRSNLRVCTAGENYANRAGLSDRLGFIGIEQRGKRWCIAGAHSGTFTSRAEAAFMRDLAALKEKPRFAVLNFPWLRDTLLELAKDPRWRKESA